MERSGSTSSSRAHEKEMKIDSADIIRLILQYCQENNLVKTLKALREETKVTLNTVENAENFERNILHGRWEPVLGQLQNLTLPSSTSEAVYELILLELLEGKEFSLVSHLLTSSGLPQISIDLKRDSPERYYKLKQLAEEKVSNSLDVYLLIGGSKEKRRKEVANAIKEELVTIPNSQLLRLIGQALNYQQLDLKTVVTEAGQEKTISTTTTGGGDSGGVQQQTSLLETKKIFTKSNQDKTGHSKSSRDLLIKDQIPTTLNGMIKFGSGNNAECANFTPNGTSLVTGSTDGFLEVWNYETCKLNTELKYQQEENYMSHASKVMTLCFSSSGELIASGDQGGNIFVWRVSNGLCLRKFMQVHNEGVTSLAFSKDCSNIASASLDATVRIHGLKSGRTLKDFVGHTSYVNCVKYSHDGSNFLITGASDGLLKVWKIISGECVTSFSPSKYSDLGRHIAIHTIIPLPPGDYFGGNGNNSSLDMEVESGVNYELFLVASMSPTMYITTIRGVTLKEFSIPLQVDSTKASSSSSISSGQKSMENVNTTSRLAIPAKGNESYSQPDICAVCLSAQAKYLYAAASNGQIYVFDIMTGHFLESFATGSPTVVGIGHHPTKSLLTTYSNDNVLKIWGRK